MTTLATATHTHTTVGMNLAARIPLMSLATLLTVLHVHHTGTLRWALASALSNDAATREALHGHYLARDYSRSTLIMALIDLWALRP